MEVLKAKSCNRTSLGALLVIPLRSFQYDTLLVWFLAAYYPSDACLITLIFVLTNFPYDTSLKLLVTVRSQPHFL